MMQTRLGKQRGLKKKPNSSQTAPSPSPLETGGDDRSPGDLSGERAPECQLHGDLESPKHPRSGLGPPQRVLRKRPTTQAPGTTSLVRLTCENSSSAHARHGKELPPTIAEASSNVISENVPHLGKLVSRPRAGISNVLKGKVSEEADSRSLSDTTGLKTGKACEKRASRAQCSLQHLFKTPHLPLTRHSKPPQPPMESSAREEVSQILQSVALSRPNLTVEMLAEVKAQSEYRSDELRQSDHVGTINAPHNASDLPTSASMNDKADSARKSRLFVGLGTPGCQSIDSHPCKASMNSRGVSECGNPTPVPLLVPGCEHVEDLAADNLSLAAGYITPSGGGLSTSNPPPYLGRRFLALFRGLIM
jgi:hypothetical protein